MKFWHKLCRLAFGATIMRIVKNKKTRQKNLLHLLNIAKKFMGNTYSEAFYENAGKLICEKDSKWMMFTDKLLDETHPRVIRKHVLNVGYEAIFHGIHRVAKMSKLHDCTVPWAILMDPTSACNLKCEGCWAAQYGHKVSLSYDDLDRIVSQGKELGCYFYLYTGGEPLVRKADLIRLCDVHKDCIFHAFTNGTLINDAFCKEMVRVGNLSLSISLEGFSETNDARRGAGTFDKVMASMDLLKKHRLFFGASVCYTSKNIDSVTSDEFFDMMIEKGCRFAWYFHYMPIGSEARPELLPTKEQREHMYHRIREIRDLKGGKSIFAIDFQNDGEFVGGCIAGGRVYLHINANGDVEPCVFIHYSSANIKEVSLLDALKQPLFRAYRRNQPFNKNHLRPCPMLENPELLQSMVKASGAASTDLQSPEPVESLCGKCSEYAAVWKEKAEELWTK